MVAVFNLLFLQNNEEAHLLLQKLERNSIKKDLKMYITKIKDVVKRKDFLELVKNVSTLDPKRRVNNVKNWEVITYAKNYVLENNTEFDTKLVDRLRKYKQVEEDFSKKINDKQVVEDTGKKINNKQVEKQTNKKQGKHIDKQEEKQTKKNTNKKQVEKQTSKKQGKHIEKQIEEQTDNKTNKKQLEEQTNDKQVEEHTEKKTNDKQEDKFNKLC